MSLFGAVRLYVVGRTAGDAEPLGLLGPPGFGGASPAPRRAAADVPRAGPSVAAPPREQARRDAVVVPVSPVTRGRGTLGSARRP